MRTRTISAVARLFISTLATAQAEFPVKLAGHVIIPSETFIAVPADAPADLQTSGKFADGPARIGSLGSREGKSAGRPSGVKFPFQGQPIQGHSGNKNPRPKGRGIQNNPICGSECNC